MVQLINARTPLPQARASLAEHFDLRFSRAVQKETEAVFARIRGRINEAEWPHYAPLIVAINRQKREVGATILAHHYQTPQIVHGVADVVGDSIRLAVEASSQSSETALVCGLHHMAQTVKLLNGGKRVLLPDSRGRSRAASSITPADVLAMRSHYPGVPVVAYMSSTAEVKALSDICCTSGNALDIVEALPGDAVIVLPDQYLAQNTAHLTTKKIITWGGASELHGAMRVAHVEDLRRAYPGAKLVAHLECPPEVVGAVDFAGSNSALIEWIKSERAQRVVLIAEGSLADNLASFVPGTELIHGAGFCPQMKRITLENILWALHSGEEEIRIDEAVAFPAERALTRMLDFSSTGQMPDFGRDAAAEPVSLP